MPTVIRAVCPDVATSGMCLPGMSDKTFYSGHIHPKMISTLLHLLTLYQNKTLPYISFRGVTIHLKYGSPQYEAGSSIHGPFLVISVRFTPKNFLEDKIKKKIAEKLLKCCFYVDSYLILLY